MDDRRTHRAAAAYTSPECRAADGWPEAHQLCAGTLDATVGKAVVERLRCDCPCHT
ncbi:hypothetical protein AB0O08_11630 [Streptomyces anulatus]|uniref:hypothetical protein n=1 Tax=Streptomyces anulatus TaxID=1892 RepID=UPI003435FF4C